MKKIVLVGLALAGMASGPAFAAGGITMADHATIKLHVVKTEPADMMTSKLIGMNVYNKQNESIGEIKDLVMKDGKTLTGVVVSVGGFLGMGESYVLVDPASIAIADKDGTMKAFVDTTKDTLKGEPKFTYDNKKS